VWGTPVVALTAARHEAHWGLLRHLAIPPQPEPAVVVVDDVIVEDATSATVALSLMLLLLLLRGAGAHDDATVDDMQCPGLGAHRRISAHTHIASLSLAALRNPHHRRSQGALLSMRSGGAAAATGLSWARSRPPWEDPGFRRFGVIRPRESHNFCDSNIPTLRYNESLKEPSSVFRVVSTRMC
jgi:hypothetical protein